MVFYAFCYTMKTLLDIMVVLMFIRAILSWIMPMDGNRFTDFVERVTDLVIAPVRVMMDRFEFARRSPLDLSFFVTFLLLELFSNVFAASAYLFL